MQKDNCLFCKIAKGEIPSKKIYEDEEMVAFHDINPAAPIHFLVIPKKHITSLADATPEDSALLGRILVCAKTLALQNGCANGFRTVINTGKDGGQVVPHLHVHILGGAHPWKHETKE